MVDMIDSQEIQAVWLPSVQKYQHIIHDNKRGFRPEVWEEGKSSCVWAGGGCGGGGEGGAASRRESPAPGQPAASCQPGARLYSGF